MSSGGLEALSLVLHDFQDGMLIPEDGNTIEFTGTIYGLENFEYNENVQLSFMNENKEKNQNKSVVIHLQEEHIRHTLPIISSNIEDGSIHMNTKTITGEYINIKITNVEKWDLRNFKYEICIPKFSLDNYTHSQNALKLFKKLN